MGKPKGEASIPEGRIGGTLSSKIVLETYDVIFSEIGSCLYLDKDEYDVANVLNAVGDTGGYVDGVALGDENLSVVKCDTGPPADSHPMLRTVGVALIAQTLSG